MTEGAGWHVLRNLAKIRGKHLWAGLLVAEPMGTPAFGSSCGSSLFDADGSDEIEFRLGTLDDSPAHLAPSHELWTIGREHWLKPIADTARHERYRL